jgi:hypothetical protein
VRIEALQMQETQLHGKRAPSSQGRHESVNESLCPPYLLPAMRDPLGAPAGS